MREDAAVPRPLRPDLTSTGAQRASARMRGEVQALRDVHQPVRPFPFRCRVHCGITLDRKEITRKTKQMPYPFALRIAHLRQSKCIHGIDLLTTFDGALCVPSLERAMTVKYQVPEARP